MQFRIFTIFSLCFSLGLGLLLGQTNDPLGDNKDIVLENERIEDVIDSEKPFIKPPYQEIKQPDKSTMQYLSKDFYIETDFDPAPPDIKPINPVKPEKYKNNHLKLGIGRFITPLVQLYLNNGRERNTDWGFYFKHLSAHQDNIPLRQFRENYGQLKGSVVEKKYTINGEAHLYNTSYFQYQQETTDALADSLRMSFTNFGLSAGILSNEDPKAQGSYDLGAGINFFRDRRSNTEFSIDIRPDFAYEIAENFNVNWESELSFMLGSIGDVTQNRVFFDASPTIEFNNSELMIRGGLRFNFFNNSGDTTSFTNLGPMIEASYAVVPESFVIQAGFITGMSHNAYQGLIDVNRYLTSDVLIRPS
ncbi:MAG: hypothetical protein AAF206_25060, partial [Bacteroidota bacterium]